MLLFICYIVHENRRVCHLGLSLLPLLMVFDRCEAGGFRPPRLA